MKQKIKKVAIPPLYGRIAAFLVLCVICTGIIGPRIIASGILNRDGFGIYGGAGKAFLFGAIAFALLVRGKINTVKLKPWDKSYLICLAAYVLFIICSWSMVSRLIYGQNSTFNVLFTHLLMITTIVLAAFATIGIGNLRTLIGKFKKEIILAIVISGAFYIFLWAVYGLWRYLSIIVLHAVTWLLDLSGLDVVVVPDLTILLDKFGVTIEKYCSGIESIALFTGLYVIVGILDWHKLNVKRFLSVYPIALLILFGLNILRVYALIMAGYYINTELAFSLFHTYAGMVFFMIYAGIFWTVMYKHLLKKKVVDKPAKKAKD